MQASNKKQLVMIGIRRRGENGFKLKTIKQDVDLQKAGLAGKTGQKRLTTSVFA